MIELKSTSDHKAIVQNRVVSELRRVQQEVVSKINTINTRREMSQAIFGAPYKLDNYMKPSDKWADPGLANLFVINQWLANNHISLVDINFIFYGDQHPYKKILDNIQAKTGIDVFGF